MPTIADYVVLQDATVNLPGTTGDLHRQFNAPGVNPSSQSILTFRVNPQIGSGDVTLRVRVNDHVAVTQVFNTEPQRSWQEVMPAGAIGATNNELIASIPSDSGGGSLQISDIVIFTRQTSASSSANGVAAASVAQ
jgi:hypothetical protein